MKAKAVIFDFNGTLFFDSEFHEIAWTKILEELVDKSDVEQIRKNMHGNTNKDIIKTIRPDFNEETVERYSKKKEELYREICLQNPEKVKLVDEAEEVFGYLKQKNIPFTIASASIKENIDFFITLFSLDKWIKPTKIVYDDGRFTDKVGMFQEASKVLSVPLEDCIIVEDSVVGITCAKAVKPMTIIGIGPEENYSKLRDLGARYCISDYTTFPYTII